LRKISKSDITHPKVEGFQKYGITWNLNSIPFKWVPMLWGFNGVVKLPIFLHSDFGDKSRPPSLKGLVTATSVGGNCDSVECIFN
jgi:hypothetical protein